jgi:hypothetical protein
VLGPIQQVGNPGEVAAADPTDQQQQDQQQEEQKKDQADGNDDGSVDAALGLINSGPVQLKNDLEQPVTSGGMDSIIENPGTPD